MYFLIRRSLPARPELDNTFWTDSTKEELPSSAALGADKIPGEANDLASPNLTSSQNYKTEV